jgi:serine/threonine protein phosphatase PrpC
MAHQKAPLIEVVCPKCKGRNPWNARHCRHCPESFEGFALSPELSNGLLPPQSQTWGQRLNQVWNKVWNEQPAVPPRPAVSSYGSTQVLGPPLANAIPKSPTSIHQNQTIADKYRVAGTFPMSTCTYYEVTRLKAEQQLFLLRETAARPSLPPLDSYRQLVRQKIRNVLEHADLDAWDHNQRLYTLLSHPGPGWRSLARIPVPIPRLKDAIAWTIQTGIALADLADLGYGFWPRETAGREGIIIANGTNLAKLADLTLCQPAAHDVATADAQQGLAALLYYLAVGRELSPQDRQAAEAPTPIRRILQRALAGDYSTIKAMTDELAHSQDVPVLERPLRQNAGVTTHPGRHRDLNEDFAAALNLSLNQVGTEIPTGLYIVADGMGGHAAGEKASADSVRQAFSHFINQSLLPQLQGATRRLDIPLTPDHTLRALVQQANQIVVQHRQKTGEDRGSTITAVLILGNQATIANVGDSRTYLWRRGQLTQITHDHSLVYRLMQTNQITRDEIYTHPQRNQVYRSLGDKAQLEVDIFSETLQPGDRLLLCSDGLWEMLRDPDIQAILNQAPSLQAACDKLIDRANANGGEDNISAIVVGVE